MVFTWIDWAIVVVFIFLLVSVAVYANRYTRSVADFLSANRSAGRYLLTIAGGMASLGAITLIADFQKYYKSGFGGGYWMSLIGIVTILIPLTGWVIYPLRQTRALTLAQFLEMRYSRKFRLFAGITAFISGVINYGIFPGISARFFIYFCGIPQHYIQVGPLEFDITLGAVMFVLLSIALYLTISGGQISVMITDFLQGQFVNIVIVTISIYLLTKFSWPQIFSTLVENAPQGKSLVNPFQQAGVEGFAPTFFFMWAFKQFYTHRVWQGSQGYSSAAKSPHEAKMAGILGGFRQDISGLLMLVIPICAFVLLHSNVYPQATEAARQAIESIPGKWDREIGTVILSVKQLLPTGLLGLLAAVVLAAAISTDDTAIHSWGSIFVQDVILPFKKEHLSPEKHIKMLRWSCVGVAAFAWFFSMIFTLRDFIFMYFQITGAIFLGGAGIAVIGGLYWKRGTTAGAWTGLITGVFLASIGILVSNVLWKPMLPYFQGVWTDWAWLKMQNPEVFPLNGMEMAFSTALICSSLYGIVSLCTKNKPGFSLDKIRHRGEFALESEYKVKSKRNKYLAVLGLNEEFTKFDKFLWYFKLFWSLFWWALMVFMGIFWYYGIWKESWFPTFWIFKLWTMIIMAMIIAFWFLGGGFRDLFRLFKTLREIKRDELDDGTVYESDKNLPKTEK